MVHGVASGLRFRVLFGHDCVLPSGSVGRRTDSPPKSPGRTLRRGDRFTDRSRRYGSRRRPPSSGFSQLPACVRKSAGVMAPAPAGSTPSSGAPETRGRSWRLQRVGQFGFDGQAADDHSGHTQITCAQCFGRQRRGVEGAQARGGDDQHRRRQQSGHVRERGALPRRSARAARRRPRPAPGRARRPASAAASAICSGRTGAGPPGARPSRAPTARDSGRVRPPVTASPASAPTSRDVAGLVRRESGLRGLEHGHRTALLQRRGGQRRRGRPSCRPPCPYR